MALTSSRSTPLVCFHFCLLCLLLVSPLSQTPTRFIIILKLHAETHPCFKFARYLVRPPHDRRVHVWIELFFDEALMEAKQTRLHATMRGMNLPSRLRDAIDRIITLFICPVSYGVHIVSAVLFIFRHVWYAYCSVLCRSSCPRAF